MCAGFIRRPPGTILKQRDLEKAALFPSAVRDRKFWNGLPVMLLRWNLDTAGSRFPANGRTINSGELIRILFDFLPQCVKQVLFIKQTGP